MTVKYFALLTALLLAPLALTVRAESGKSITDVFVDVARIRHDAKSWAISKRDTN